MKKAAILLILCLLVGCGSSQHITVMTYNIHHGEGLDANLDLPRIAGVIAAAKPDLVALQEVDLGAGRTHQVAQAQELGRLTGMHAVFGAAMDFDGGQYGNAVLCRFPIESSRTIALPWQPGNGREPRCALAVTCTPARGHKLVFVATHLDHTTQPSDRFLQAQALNDAFKAEKSPAILAGDFNCRAISAPVKELMAKWKLASKGDEGLSFPADVPTRGIDHVLVRPAERWRVIDAKVIEEKVASDHRPVVVKLELK